MKLLVFAHTPPPHHGQSYMVELMVTGFGGDRRNRTVRPPKQPMSERPFDIECYHVNARLSRKLEEIGDFRVGKLILLMGYCLQAIWCRFRHGVTILYYIPAPGKRSALYRDWVVMLLCRPFFKRVILHWHAAGLAKWLETAVQIRTRALTYRFLRRVDLSIVLSEYNRADAEKIFSRQVGIVSNGIPDPCPRFETEVLPRRRARFNARQKVRRGEPLLDDDLNESNGAPEIIRVLFLAHCTREKGLFDAMQGVTLANERLASEKSSVRLRLGIAGTFVTNEEKEQFEQALAEQAADSMIDYLGFVSGERKNRLLREADLFCFPTYYQNENQPVNLIEAMAFGLPILTTRWRSIPELFPPNYTGLVEIRSPQQVADGLLRLAFAESGEGFRHIFLKEFTLERHLAGLAEAFHSAASA